MKWAIPGDTSLAVARLYFERLKQMGAEKRLMLAMSLSDDMRSIVESGIRFRHPDYDESRIRLALLRSFIGEESFRLIHPDLEVRP